MQFNNPLIFLHFPSESEGQQERWGCDWPHAISSPLLRHSESQVRRSRSQPSWGEGWVFPAQVYGSSHGHTERQTPTNILTLRSCSDSSEMPVSLKCLWEEPVYQPNPTDTAAATVTRADHEFHQYNSLIITSFYYEFSQLDSMWFVLFTPRLTAKHFIWVTMGKLMGLFVYCKCPKPVFITISRLLLYCFIHNLPFPFLSIMFLFPFVFVSSLLLPSRDTNFHSGCRWHS